MKSAAFGREAFARGNYRLLQPAFYLITTALVLEPTLAHPEASAGLFYRAVGSATAAQTDKFFKKSRTIGDTPATDL